MHVVIHEAAFISHFHPHVQSCFVIFTIFFFLLRPPSETLSPVPILQHIYQAPSPQYNYFYNPLT